MAGQQPILGVILTSQDGSQLTESVITLIPPQSFFVVTREHMFIILKSNSPKLLWLSPHHLCTDKTNKKKRELGIAGQVISKEGGLLLMDVYQITLD